MQSGPQRVAMSFGDTEVDLIAAGPHDEFVRLLEAARARTGGAGPSIEEIRELARRKLGRLSAFGFEATIDGLPDRLEAGERVERLAGATIEFDGLLVLTDRRLLLIDTGTLRRANERCWEVDRGHIRAARREDDGIRLSLADGETAITAFRPPERLDEFAAVLDASSA